MDSVHLEMVIENFQNFRSVKTIQYDTNSESVKKANDFCWLLVTSLDS